MPHWMIKAGIQGTLSRLPQPARWNRLFQRYITRSLRMSEPRVLGKWAQCQRHAAHWAEHGSGRPPVVLELGTGWFPVVPLGMFLLGAARVESVDITALMSDEAPLQTAACYLSLSDAGRLEGVEPERVERLREALARARTGPALLAAVDIRAQLADARELPHPADSVDLFVSNNTLEHVPEASIRQIFAEFRRVSRAGSLMSHFIDMADHYALFDRSITVFNYMRYSEAQWRRFNNSLHYQNRLRLSDYRRLHEAEQWRVLTQDPTEGSAEQLARVPLDPAFRAYSELDLRAFESWMVSTGADE